MAQINNPGGIPGMNGMSGKFNGVIFSRNRYGLNARPYVKPTNPKTVSQQKVRSVMAYLNQKWHSLTIEEMLEWNDAAHKLEIKSKDKKGFLTGYMFFMQVNMNIVNAGREPRLKSPERLNKPQQLAEVGVLVITKPKHEEIFMKFSPNLDSNNVLVVSATAPVRTPSMPADNRFRQIGVINKSWNPGDMPSSIMSLYEKKFGSRIGMKERAGFKFQIIEKRTGQAGKAIYVFTRVI